MPIVTITSDLGLKDYYLAAIKGSLLSKIPDLTIVDITHNIESHDIVQAAFIFKNAWKNFPEGSIHLLSVKNFYGKKRRFIAFEAEGQFFVGPDNGIFSLVFDEMSNNKHYEISLPDDSGSFPIKDLFTEVVEKLSQDADLQKIGTMIEDMVRRITFQPVITASEIKGSVIHIDSYENVIVNISKTLFEKIGQGRAFELYFKRHDPIIRLNNNYSEVPIGEALCLFNYSGLLEIAINMGKASSLLGLKIEDTVQINFL